MVLVNVASEKVEAFTTAQKLYHRVPVVGEYVRVNGNYYEVESVHHHSPDKNSAFATVHVIGWI